MHRVTPRLDGNLGKYFRFRSGICGGGDGRDGNRAGEVLETIEPSKGGRPSKTGTADTSLSRTQAAQDAENSKRQRLTAPAGLGLLPESRAPPARGLFDGP